MLVVLPARFLPSFVDVPVPACVLLVVLVFWEADVVWLVVALGLIVTVLFGIAFTFASVLTVVLALGAVDCVAVVLVLLPALFVVCASAMVLVAASTAAAIMLRFFKVLYSSRS